MGRKMKDSGVEWIGEIPDDWKVLPLKYSIQWKSEKGHGDENVLSLYRDYGVILKDSREDNHNVTSLDTDSYKFVEIGDLVINKMKAWQGSLAVSSYQGIVSPAYHVCRITDDRINKRYLHYLLRNQAYLPEYNRLSTGMRIGQWDLGFDDFKNLPFLLPTMQEQEKIANYIDNKLKYLDVSVKKIQDCIDNYKSLKQSLITRAVTKGVRGKREMKDSGIEWIGHYPSDWELRPFRYILKERQEKNSPIKSKERLSLSIDLGVTLYAEKTTNLDRFKDDFEQYKLAYPGDLVMNSMNMIVGASGVSDYFGCVSPVYYTFYDDTENHVTAKFCEYIFRSRAMMRVLFSMGKGIYAIVRGDDRVNTCRLKVSKEDLKSLKLPLPSLYEQQEIVTYLDKKLSDIDTLIVKKEQLVSELENYKKSLIYEYVTGKREVLA